MAPTSAFEFESVSAGDLSEAGIERLPRRSAILRIFDRNHSVILLERTHNLANRLRRFYSLNPERTALDLRRIGTEINFCLTDSPFESQYLLYLERRRCFPATYRRMKTFPLYYLLAFDMGLRFPRIDTVPDVRVGARHFGPFARRSQAERLKSDVERIFGTRPCEYDIQGDTAYPECLYFQIHTCSRPCNGDIDRRHYLEDVGTAAEFISGNRADCLSLMRSRIEHLAETMRFEEAEQVRVQMNRLEESGLQPAQKVFELERFDYVVLLRARSVRRRKVVTMRAGRILSFEEHEADAIPEILRASLRSTPRLHADPAAHYDEFCLTASMLIRPTRSMQFIPLDDPDKTAARVAEALTPESQR